MEAKLKIADYDCYNKSFSTIQRKEESRDAVVPDTQPDIAEVLFCGGKLLIRSKDISAGRVRIEANLPACVLYRGEDGKIYTVDVSVPVFLSAEDDKISDEATATARLKLLGLEARALNPRKVLVNAELSAEISVYESGKFSLAEGVEEESHIKSRVVEKEISLIAAVTEKSFALSGELILPPAVDQGAKLIDCGCECVVDELKTVGSKLIVKGRVKSALMLINPDGELCHLEPVTDFSQIIDIGRELGGGASFVWLIPSGSYCHISPESEGRIVLEYHMVAQLVCRNDVAICCVDEAYSNQYELSPQWTELKAERVREPGRIRESFRQLFETARGLGEVMYAGAWLGVTHIEKGKLVLPLTFSAVCCDSDGPWCEKRRCELGMRLPAGELELSLKSVEIIECSVLPVPGGMELRIELSAELFAREEECLRPVCSIEYDEDRPLDNSSRPSLVLLRPQNGDELWDIARANCSDVRAILAANELENVPEAIGRLILIPKTN